MVLRGLNLSPFNVHITLARLDMWVVSERKAYS